jgi:hypothetical protein
MISASLQLSPRVRGRSMRYATRVQSVRSSWTVCSRREAGVVVGRRRVAVRVTVASVMVTVMCENQSFSCLFRLSAWARVWSLRWASSAVAQVSNSLTVCQGRVRIDPVAPVEN